MDKVIIVTGSSRGIGLAIAEGLAAAGATIVVSSTKEEKSKEVATRLAAEYGVKTLGVGVDVSDEASVKAMVDATMAAFGRVDVLVNNAGITRDNLLLRMSAEDWQSVITTNLNSVFYCSKAVLRPMLKQRAGRIITISSVVGQMGNPGQANYAASKAGAIAFTKSLAKEYGPKGILANVVAPGFIETDMIESLPEQYLNTIIESVPLRRLGQVSDIANLVSFLASDQSQYMTGQVLTIDGGLLM
ncbi:MAG: 3-oxoacyl-ACP reductase FabG [bacterium]|nr:3-oxoacyl-ACP reductase FabG [bacterium]